MLKYQSSSKVWNLTVRYRILAGLVIVTGALLYAIPQTGFNNIPECPSHKPTVKVMSMPYTAKPDMIQISVGPGDNIFSILRTSGVTDADSAEIIRSLKKIHNVDKIKVGDQITMRLNGYNKVNYIAINNQSSLKNIKILRDGDSGRYDAEVVNSVHDKRVLRASDTIRSSLFATAIEQGLSSATVMKLVKLYGNNVDLKKEVLPGSTFDVLFERFFDEHGNPLLDGKILYASLKIDNKVVNLYNHVLPNGQDEYFDDNGMSVKKTLFQNPLNGNFRISSKFGNRHHPIYGQTKFHKGVDFAAVTGTPISAAADGVIEYIGNRGGYGKYIKIKHSNLYSTAYAHISRFQKNLKVGSHVKQGEVIAFVGNTGLSTGSHLHYEVIRNGRPINPMTVESAPAVQRLSNDDMLSFQVTMRKVHQTLKDTPYATEFAMNTKVLPSPTATIN